MAEVKIAAASGGGSISIKGPSSSGSDVDLLDTSGNLKLSDGDELRLGTGDDLKIYHESVGTSYIAHSHSGGNPLHITSNGDIKLRVADEDGVIVRSNGAVELFHNNVKVFQTHAEGFYVYGPEGSDASIYWYSDEGDDNADKWRIRNNQSTFLCDQKSSGSWVNAWEASSSWFLIHSIEGNQGGAVLKLQKPEASGSVQSDVITFEVGGNGRGKIVAASSGSGNPAFSTYSDRRLKTNFRSYTGGYDKIKAIPVKLYDEVSNDETKSVIGDTPATNVAGWIADEFQTVFPAAVQGTKDAVDSDGKPEYQTIASTTILPDVVQALQAAIAKIEVLETKVAALEAG